MKKSLVMAITTGLVLSTCSAFAAEVPNPFDIQFDGSLSTQYRQQRDENNYGTTKDNTKTGMKTTLILNADKKISDNLDLYARFSYQFFNVGTSINDTGFYQDYIDKDYNSKIDAFGLKYTNAGVKYTLGSQPLTIGNGLIYDNGYIGKYALPYAAKIDAKVGATDLTVIAAETNYQGSLDNDKFYVVQGSYAISPKTTVGASYTHVSYGKDTVKNSYFTLPYDSENFYGLTGNFTFDKKWSASTEFVKSDADDDNTGYIGGVSYKVDGKNTIGVGYFRVENRANIDDYNMGGMTTAPYNNAKGYSVSWKNQFSKDVSLTVANFKYDKINDDAVSSGANSDRQRFTTTLSVLF